MTKNYYPINFSFAVISDTHVNPSDDTCNSPFAVNTKANDRLKATLRQLNQLNLDFVLHLGDLLHPVPANADPYRRAAEKYQLIISELKHPIYHIPGNHDVGDKPLDWSPAVNIANPYIAIWKECFGQPYFHFEHHHCHFIGINAQLLNSNLRAETEQKMWLEALLTEVSKKKSSRIFLCTHYPPYLDTEDENEHYDNIALTGRRWLLSLLEKYQVEALFSGHVHNFWYHLHGNTHCYSVPATAFVRQDYSELFNAPPGPDMEFGRDDKQKLGFFQVDITDDHHSVAFIAADKTTTTAPHSNRNQAKNLALYCRHDWLGNHSIPSSGALDEFDRKTLRNDYPLLRCWEMGIKTLRIPFSDIQNDTNRRLFALNQQGLVFTVSTHGIPSAATFAKVVEYQPILHSWEIIVTEEDYPTLLTSLPCDRSLSVDIIVSIIAGRTHNNPTEIYYHVIKHGFGLESAAEISERMTQDSGRLIKGFVFNIGQQDSVIQSADAISQIVTDLSIKANICLQQKSANPAKACIDTVWNANRIAQAFIANQLNNIQIYVDTLQDVDRGYFVHQGLIDSSCNPHIAATILKLLNHYFGQKCGTIKLINLDNTDNDALINFSYNRHLYQLQCFPSRHCLSPPNNSQPLTLLDDLLDISDSNNLPRLFRLAH